MNITDAKKMSLVVYVLFLISIVMPPVAVIAIILAFVKRNEMRGTIYYNHMLYLIRTSLASFVLWIVGLILTLIFVGYLVLFCVSIWFAFRVIYGFVQFNHNENIDPYKWFLA
ncbi:DUF4870 family protein [Wohlfahrtiimonas chitiniclastica]|uniref:DUF4870 family protein n=1 Tax=Wohlfahrtiimonas chitiniclastica TaxID=400946 RepID=UPI000B996F2C|nr:hypothetical protein [Wohlfahrtiimonas chitiniclastica]OYQ76472.1 hypothetical protein B9T18_03655 [Wohlfahrtiimonas chitiniclastica]